MKVYITSTDSRQIRAILDALPKDTDIVANLDKISDHNIFLHENVGSLSNALDKNMLEVFCLDSEIVLAIKEARQYKKHKKDLKCLF